MNSSNSKIVFTGSGLVCGAGSSVNAVWESLVSGSSAIKPIERWDASRWPIKNAAEVKESNRTLVPNRKIHKSISRTDMFGLYASEGAVQDSGVLEKRDEMEEDVLKRFNDRSGIISGTGGGKLSCNYDYFPLMAEVGGDLKQFGQELGNMVTPMWLLRNLPNNVLCHAGIKYQMKGYNACIMNHCAGGIMAVCEAAEAIKSDDADRMMAVGHDAPLDPEDLFYYYACGLASSGMLHSFDKKRGGTVLGEGAGAVIIEKYEDAVDRGGQVLGEFLGSGSLNEASGILDIRDDGDGVRRVIELALKNANLQKEDIGAICAHGSGTVNSDLSEALGIRGVFGESIPPVTSLKWCYGHLLSSAGIVDVTMALKLLQEGVVPGLAALEEVDSRCDFLPLSTSNRELEKDKVLVLCRGFGGMNVAVILGAVA